MKYIPTTVVLDILKRCNYVNHEIFAANMIPIDKNTSLSEALSFLVEKCLDKDPLYREWALNELKGVECDDDTELYS